MLNPEKIMRCRAYVTFGRPSVRPPVCLSNLVTFFNHNFVNCKATLIMAIKIYEIKYNISLNDIHT